MFFPNFNSFLFWAFCSLSRLKFVCCTENYTMLLCVCPNEDYLDVLIFVSRFFLVNEKMDFVFAQSEGKKG